MRGDLLKSSECRRDTTSQAEINENIANDPQKSLEARKYACGWTGERNTKNRTAQITDGIFERGENNVETYVAKPKPSKVDSDHTCETYRPFVPEPCLRGQLQDGDPSCNECSHVFEYADGSPSTEPSYKNAHQKRKVRFSSTCDHKDDDVDYKPKTYSREQIPAVGEAAYGDVPYLNPYHDASKVKRELNQGHPDNLYTSGPFQGRSETSEKFVNPGLSEKASFQLRKRFMEPPPFYARSVYKDDFEPPYPRKPLDIHAARMTREPEVEWERSPKVKNPHKEEYRPPPLKEPQVICVQDPPPRYLESTYNTDYICYQRNLKPTSKIKDFKNKRDYAKEAIMSSHLECPNGNPRDYVCSFCLCCPPCECPGDLTAVSTKERIENNEMPPYYKMQEWNQDLNRISALCKGHDYHPQRVIQKY